MKSVVIWGKRTAQKPEQQISNCDYNSSDLHGAARDAVMETRGDFKDYRPGDIWRILQGTVFQR